MSPNCRKIAPRMMWAGVVFTTFTMLIAARAEVISGAHVVAPAATPAVAAPQQTTTALATPDGCSAPAALARFDYPLRRTARRLANGDPLTIVAIGSSSTAGAGASSPAASYPARLAVELRQRFPNHVITVLNRGINGEETDQMMDRFAADVMAEHPQLVLWQVGTNSVLRDRSLEVHEA